VNDGNKIHIHDLDSNTILNHHLCLKLKQDIRSNTILNHNLSQKLKEDYIKSQLISKAKNNKNY
jgi:hypothetical protein